MNKVVQYKFVLRYVVVEFFSSTTSVAYNLRILSLSALFSVLTTLGIIIIIIIIIKNECHSNIIVDRLQGCGHSKKLREGDSESRSDLRT